MSFYRAYTDKFEMLEKICYENMIVFVKIYGKNAKWKDITLCILNIIHSNQNFYYNILTCDEGLISFMKALSNVSSTMTGSPASKSSYEIWMYTLKTWALNKFTNNINFVYKELILNLPIREIMQDKDLDEIVEIYENRTMSYYRGLNQKKEKPKD